MDGYMEFRQKMQGKKYLNRESIGMSVGTVTSITPVTLEIPYGSAKISFTRFTSLISLDYLREKDIGKAKFLVFIKGGAETICYILGTVFGDIKDLYIEEEE